MTFEVILHQMKKFCLHNVGINIKFYQNRFINESVRENLANIPPVTQSHRFFVTYRRTYVYSKKVASSYC